MNRGGEFYFDAVRIFDPLLSMNKTPENENEKEAKAAYLADSELLMQRYEVRDLLIDAETYNAGDRITGSSGVAFVDGVNGTDAEGVTVAEYAKIGPNNEVYLSVGQAVAFELSNLEGVDALQIGMKSVDGKPVKFVYQIQGSASGERTLQDTILTSTAQNYELKLPANQDTCYVLIYNLGGQEYNGILSITDAKLLGTGASTATRAVFRVNAGVELFANDSMQSLYTADRKAACTIQSTQFIGDNRSRTIVLQVVTSQYVDHIDVVQSLPRGKSTEVIRSYKDLEDGTRLWEAKVLMMYCKHGVTVTAYDEVGTAGDPVTVFFYRTIRF